MSASVLVGPIVTAAPAHAACVSWFGQCNDTPPTTAPPPTTPPTTAPPAAAVPAPTPPPSPDVSPEEAATMFFDATNGARAVAGLPALGWREDVATMATSHSADMAQEGAISHGPFVSDATLKALNAHTVGENVGMGQTVESIQDALMASEHHRDNILDANFNQVGIGVVEGDGLYYVTEDFLEAKGGPVTPRPKAVARPATSLVAAPRRVSHAVAKPKPAPAAVRAAVSPPPAAPVGVVTAVPSDSGAAPREATPMKLTPPGARTATGLSAWWAALLGSLVLLGCGGHLGVRRRRRKG